MAQDFCILCFSPSLIFISSLCSCFYGVFITAEHECVFQLSVCFAEGGRGPGVCTGQLIKHGLGIGLWSEELLLSVCCSCFSYITDTLSLQSLDEAQSWDRKALFYSTCFYWVKLNQHTDEAKSAPQLSHLSRIKPSDFQMDFWTPMFITCVDEMLPITMVTSGH